MRVSQAKVLALLLIALVLPYQQFALIALADIQSPEKSIADSFEIVALFLYRGPIYSTYGQVRDFTVSLFDEEGNFIRMNYSELVDKALRGEIKLRLKIENAAKVGTLTLSYDIMPIILTGGSYPNKLNTFNEGSISGYVGSYNDTFWGSYRLYEHVIFENPFYMYSIVRLGNGSKLVVPKGENVVLMLVPKADAWGDYASFMLETFLSRSRHGGSCFYISEFERLTKAWAKDDPLSRLLQLSWSSEGNIGKLAYTELREVPVVVPYAADVRGEFGPFGKEWMKEGWYIWPEKIPLTKISVTNTTVFAPASYPTHSLVNYLDPLDAADVCTGLKARRIASGLSAMFIIDPDVYSGGGRVRLTISNGRGVQLATYQIDVEVGEERFKNVETTISGVYSDYSRYRGYPDYGDEAQATVMTEHEIKVRKIGYDAFGSLRLAIAHTGVQIRDYMRENSFYMDREEERTFISFGGDEEVLIGGWLPNPPPPGAVIYVPEMKYDFSYSWYRTYNYQMSLEKIHSCITVYDLPEQRPPDVILMRAWIKATGEPLEVIRLSNGYAYLSGAIIDELGKGCPDIFTRTSMDVTDIGERRARGTFVSPLMIQLTPVPLAASPIINGYLSGVVSEGSYFSIEHEMERVETTTFHRSSPEILAEYSIYIAEKGQHELANFTGTINVYKVYREDFVRSIIQREKPSFVSEYVYGPEMFSTGSAAFEVPERPALVIWLDREEAYPGDSLKVYVSRYGGMSEAEVSVTAVLTLPDEREVKLNVTPGRLRVGLIEPGTAAIDIPTVERLREISGTNITNEPMTLLVTAVDEEGGESRALATVYGAGVYIVLDIIDVGIPLPEDPWDTNVLSYILANLDKYERERPLRGGDYRLNVKILDKSTKEQIYSEEVKGDKLVLSPHTLKMKAGNEYIVSYEFQLKDYPMAPVIVSDIGVDIVLTEDIFAPTDEVRKLEYSLPVPYTLMRKYFDYASMLAGEDSAHAEKLSDQYMIYDLLVKLRDKVSAYSPPSGMEEARSFVLDFLDTLERLGYMSVYLRPVVLFPTEWKNSAVTTELSVLGKGITFREPRYNLTGYSLLFDSDNYWAKLTKLIILQAQMIRTYKFVTKEVLLMSQILATLMSFENLRGLMTKEMPWDKGNILQKSREAGWFEQAKKWLKVGKSTTILMDGDVLGLMGSLSGLVLGPQFREIIEGVAGQESLVFTSKLVKFMYSLPLGELWEEFRNEAMSMFLTLLIAHLLMGAYNIWLQHIVFTEVMISPYPRTPVDTLAAILKGTGIALYYSSPSFEDIATKLSPGMKRAEDRWYMRARERELYLTMSKARPFEEGFYTAAEIYLQAQAISKTLMSITKELDSVHEAIKGEGIEVAGGREKTIVKYYVGEKGLLKSYSYEVMGTQRLVRLKDVMNRLYPALAAAILADGLAKTVWVPSFKSMLRSGDTPSVAAGYFTTVMQSLLPVVTFVAVARAPAGKTSELDIWDREAQRGLEIRLEGPWSLASSTTGPASEIKAVRAEAETLMSALRGMIERCQYNIDEINGLMEALDRAELIMRKAILRAADEELKTNLTILAAQYAEDYYDLAEIVRFLLMYPSTRAIGPLLELIEGRIDAVLSDLRAADAMISAARSWGEGPRGPLPVIRDFDIDTYDLWRSKLVRITVHNLGGSPANVSLTILGTGLYPASSSESVVIESDGRHTFVMRVEVPSEVREDLLLTLAVKLDGQIIDYLVFRAYYMYGEEAFKTVRGEGIEAISDGEVVITKEGLTMRGVSVIHIVLPGGTSYIIKLNGTQIRSGEILARDRVIVGVSFDVPVSGLLTYEPVRRESQRVSGTGEKKAADWLVVQSPSEYDVVMTTYEKDPIPYARPEDVQIVRTFAIDVLRADAGYVTIRLSMEKLGIKDPSRVVILKFDVVRDAYREIEFEVDRDKKEIVVRLSQGDPLIAVGIAEKARETRTVATVATETRTTSPGEAMPTEEIGARPSVFILLPIIVISAALAFYFMRRRTFSSAMASGRMQG